MQHCNLNRFKGGWRHPWKSPAISNINIVSSGGHVSGTTATGANTAAPQSLQSGFGLAQ